MAEEPHRKNCELCKNEATVYCASDSAYLCWSCDAKVHNANFLVARHIRSFICSQCRHLRPSFAGISPPLCPSCSPSHLSAADHDGDEDCLSSSSSCVSSTTEEEVASTRKRPPPPQKKRSSGVAVDLKVEGVLGNWCRRMAVEERRSCEVVATAVELLGGCLERMTVLPFRVSLAASFWMGMRVCCCLGNDRVDTCRNLRRLEQISGVPAKLILATESRLARVIKRRRSSRDDHEEGWAES